MKLATNASFESRCNGMEELAHRGKIWFAQIVVMLESKIYHCWQREAIDPIKKTQNDAQGCHIPTDYLILEYCFKQEFFPPREDTLIQISKQSHHIFKTYFIYNSKNSEF